MSVSAIRLAARPAGFDPSRAAHERLKAANVDLDDVRVMTGYLLVIGHQLPEKTAGGVILADRTKAEDRWQGKCGLVLKMGPTAFHDDDINKFGKERAFVGDWIVTRATDGHEVQLGGRSGGVVCKLIQDTSVQMIVKDPDSVF